MLYPNPAVNYTELVFNSNEQFNTGIQVFSNNGQLVQNIQASVQKGLNKIRINTQQFASGTYIIKVNSDKLNLSKTFIKQ
jgi:Secretion system C-terminal sorting domain